LQHDRAPEESTSLKYPSLTMVTGGARSGKSTHAQGLARAWGGDKVVYIATAPADSDSEFRARIQRHRESRPDTWTTVEEPLDLTSPIRRFGAEAAVLLIDCLTLFVTNWMLKDLGRDMLELPTDRALNPKEARVMERQIRRTIGQVQGLVREAKNAAAAVIVVTNEVGLGMVPDTPLTRYFRDTLGMANQEVAAAANRVDALVSGIPLTIKRSPCGRFVERLVGEHSE